MQIILKNKCVVILLYVETTGFVSLKTYLLKQQTLRCWKNISKLFWSYRCASDLKPYQNFQDNSELEAATDLRARFTLSYHLSMHCIIDYFYRFLKVSPEIRHSIITPR